MARCDAATFPGHDACSAASGWRPRLCLHKASHSHSADRVAQRKVTPAAFPLNDSYGPQDFLALKLMFTKHEGWYNGDQRRSAISTAAAVLIPSNPLLCARASDANCLQQITWLPLGCTSSCLLLSLRRMWQCGAPAAGVARSGSTVGQMFC